MRLTVRLRDRLLEIGVRFFRDEGIPRPSVHIMLTAHASAAAAAVAGMPDAERDKAVVEFCRTFQRHVEAYARLPTGGKMRSRTVDVA